VDLRSIQDYENRWIHKINTDKIYTSYPEALDTDL